MFIVRYSCCKSPFAGSSDCSEPWGDGQTEHTHFPTLCTTYKCPANIKDHTSRTASRPNHAELEQWFYHLHVKATTILGKATPVGFMVPRISSLLLSSSLPSSIL